MKLSAVVVAQNEAKNIARLLDSLQFADEVVVVDAMSEDDTVAISEQHGARVVTKAWAGFAEQKQFAIDNATHQWVLLVDSDEEVSQALAGQIREALTQADAADGYRILRRNQFLGGWIRHGPWVDDYQLRLFRKDHGKIARRPVHEGVQVEGELRTLVGPLNHYTHQTMSDNIARLNRYTSLEAGERVQRRRIRLFDTIVPPAMVFVRYYLGGCWRDGMRGFLLAATTAMYRSVLYIKIYLLQRETRV